MQHAEQGYFHEFFSSIQGEGLWVGVLHHFVRLSGCSASCIHCDTGRAQGRTASYWLESLEKTGNPLGVDQVLQELIALDTRHPLAEALSITGGEPLEQALFLENLLPRVKDVVLKERPVLLETNGLQPEAMARVAPLVDQVSMDIKLFSSSGLSGTMPLHRRFLASLSATPFYVKVVVHSGTPSEELAEAAQLVAEKNNATPFFIQPEGRAGSPEGGRYLMALWECARGYLADVRVIPQIHQVLDFE